VDRELAAAPNEPEEQKRLRDQRAVFNLRQRALQFRLVNVLADIAKQDRAAFNRLEQEVWQRSYTKMIGYRLGKRIEVRAANIVVTLAGEPGGKAERDRMRPVLRRTVSEGTKYARVLELFTLLDEVDEERRVVFPAHETRESQALFQKVIEDIRRTTRPQRSE
jgi:hypothetical protein